MIARACAASSVPTYERENAVCTFSFDREPGGRMLDIPGIIAGLPAQAHVYCCGPLPMLDAFEQAAKALAPGVVHVEYFAARESAATAGGFTVELARTGRTAEKAENKRMMICCSGAKTSKLVIDL